MLVAEITFESDGYTLAGNIFTPTQESKDGAFLFIQGWTGEQNVRAAAAVADLGYTAITYDMRGNGKSAGNLADFSRADFVHDATVAYDYLRERVGEVAFIGVVGNSFGSYVATMLTVERDVALLSLHVPANYPDERYDQPHLAQMTPDRIEWRKSPIDYRHNKALAAVHDFRGSIQVIEDEVDEIVPHQTSQNYAAAVALPSQLTYEVIIGAAHELTTESLRAEYCQRLTRWITESR